MLAEGKETYTEFALKHYDWERIEKTKGEIIEDQVFIFAPALVFSSVAALIKLLTGLGPPTLMAPVALEILE
jgi:hypothetical protein